MVLCTHFIIDTADGLHNDSSCKYGCLLIVDLPRGPRPYTSCKQIKDIQQTRTNKKSFFFGEFWVNPGIVENFYV